MRWIGLDRNAKSGAYVDVIDVADYLGDGPFGSASNALANMARQSPVFRKTIDSEEFKAWRARQAQEKVEAA